MSYLQVTKQQQQQPTADKVEPAPAEKSETIPKDDENDLGKIHKLPAWFFQKRPLKHQCVLPICEFCGRSYSIYPGKKSAKWGCCDTLCVGLMKQTPRHVTIQRVETEEEEEIPTQPPTNETDLGGTEDE